MKTQSKQPPLCRNTVVNHLFNKQNKRQRAHVKDRRNDCGRIRKGQAISSTHSPPFFFPIRLHSIDSQRHHKILPSPLPIAPLWLFYIWLPQTHHHKNSSIFIKDSKRYLASDLPLKRLWEFTNVFFKKWRAADVCVFVCEFLLPHVLYVCGGTDLCKRCPLPDGHKVRLNRKTTELYTVNPPPPPPILPLSQKDTHKEGGGGVGCPVVLPAIKFMLQATKKRPSIKPPLSGTDLKIGKLQIGQPVNQTPTFFHRWKGTMWTFNEKKIRLDL